MNEYRAESGGRYTFAEDFLNLQELALSYTSLIEDTGNCVLSGCQFVGNTLAPGIVYIDGKLRKFNGANISSSTDTVYIRPTQSSVNTPYANGENKLGTVEYGCLATLTQPSGNYIMLTRGSKRGYMEMEHYGKKMLLLDSEEGEQEVKGSVEFTETVKAKEISAPSIDLQGEQGAKIRTAADGSVHIIVNGTDVAFKKDSVSFTVNGVETMSVDDEMVIINGNGHANFDTVKGNSITTSSINSPNKLQKTVINKLIGIGAFDKIFSSVETPGIGIQRAATTGTTQGTGAMQAPSVSQQLSSLTVSQVQQTLSDRLEINVGASDETYSVTAIGNGRGEEMFTVDGSSGIITVSGTRHDILPSNVRRPLSKNSEGKYASSLTTYTSTDSTSTLAFTSVGYVERPGGYFEGSHIEYTIYSRGSVRLHAEVIEMEGRLYHDGAPFESKFAQLNKGLAQFVTEDVDVAALRKQIGAAAAEDVKLDEATLTQLDQFKKALEDDVVTEHTGFANIVGRTYSAAELRAQLGAVSKEEAVSDTGWQTVTSFNGVGSAKIRCINKVIYLKVACASWYDDTDARTYDFSDLTSIPTLSLAVTQNVVDAGGGVCTVSMAAGERKFVIKRLTQSNTQDAALAFVGTFI